MVFISSRQDDEMKPYRDEADSAIDAFPLTRSWAFENMPASSESAREYYLRNAAEADYVVWLVGAETTQPVIDEIHTCISAQGKLLAFLLPSISRDESTKRLLEEVGNYAKWRTVESPGELGDHIEAAISDDIIRGTRDPAPRDRSRRLMRLHGENIARCKRSWVALGVPEDVAAEFSQDRYVGYELDMPMPGIQMVVGDQGVGKTLAALRLYQKAIEKALYDTSQPFPLFLRARDLSGPLGEHVDNHVRGYALPSVQGAFIVIDGLDEVGSYSANRLLDDVVPYVEANPKVCVVITTRSLPGLKRIGQEVRVPELDRESARVLISRVAGPTASRPVMREFLPSMQEAAKRPLFAIMIGSELRQNTSVANVRPGQLVDRVVQRELREAGDWSGKVYKLLERLAVTTVYGKDIGKWEVSPRLIESGLLANSRLVSEDTGVVDFTLSIIREWFAAKALVEGSISFEDIVPVSDRWVAPIAIAIESGREEFIGSLMTKMASSDPGLAGLVLEAAGHHWYMDRSAMAPSGTAYDIGSAIRQAMRDWGSSLKELLEVIGAITQEGNIATLGIDVGPRVVTTSWYHGTESMAPVVEIPRYASTISRRSEWSPTHSTIVCPTTTWPWVIAKQMLDLSLHEQMMYKRLAIGSPDAISELAYEFACSILDRRRPSPTGIKVDDVLSYIDGWAASPEARALGSLTVERLTYTDGDMDRIRSHVAGLAAAGEEVIPDPWPNPDKAPPPGRSDWEWYEEFTEQRLLQRLNSIFEAALRIYLHMVNHWFSAFDSRFWLNGMLPVVFVGRLTVPQTSKASENRPILTWSSVPANEGGISRVAFELGGSDVSDIVQQMAIEASRKSRLIIKTYSGYLPFARFRPATELAHSWLADDLRDLGWIDTQSAMRFDNDQFTKSH